ncbi:YggT family protein [Candidatus Gracilibacteria bacterium]|nr:YggT family protein [Candidatus Gracilibacteria bacterium]
MIIRFLISFVGILFNLLFWAVFISVLMSWFSRGKTQLGIWLEQIVRPILAPFRWARIGMFDFSPIVALIILDFLRGFIINFLIRFV